MESLTFKDLIDEALAINDLSINKLATTIGVDRPWLQHALVGRRNLGYDNFEKIMEILNLPEHLNTALRTAFAKEYFGEANFSIIEHMSDVFNQMAARENTPAPQALDSTTELSELIDISELNDTQSKFLNVLYDLLYTELKNQKPTIYTTYSFDIECIRMLFLQIIRSTNRVLDYKHLLYREADSSETEVIDSYLYQFEFAGYGYNTYISQSRKGLSASPLPYFIMTSEAVIFFSQNLELFVVDKSPSTVSYINSFFQKNVASSLPFSYFMYTKEAFTLFPSLIPHTTNEPTTYCYDLSANLCLATYFSSDILADAIPDWFEHKDFFVHGIEGFFGNYKDTPHSVVWHMNSLIQFTEKDEDICDYHNVTFDILNISPKNKYALLCKLRECAYNNVIRHFIMNNKLNFPSYFHINCYSNSLILGFNFRVYDIEREQAYITTAVSQDPIVYKHLRNFSEYFEHSQYVYSTSPEYAITQIDNAIAYYKKKHNF